MWQIVTACRWRFHRRRSSPIGLHFEHALTGYDSFFEEDPEDYSQDLDNWPGFLHLAFEHPTGRERLAE